MSQASFDRLMQAIAAHDRDEFLRDSTDEMRVAVTPELMDTIVRDLAAPLGGGYESTHLGKLNEQGYEVNLWQLAFKDGSDDVLLRVVTRDEQLAGFFRE